jgi:hypothetical protein
MRARPGIPTHLFYDDVDFGVFFTIEYVFLY